MKIYLLVIALHDPSCKRELPQERWTMQDATSRETRCPDNLRCPLVSSGDFRERLQGMLAHFHCHQIIIPGASRGLNSLLYRGRHSGPCKTSWETEVKATGNESSQRKRRGKRGAKAWLKSNRNDLLHAEVKY